jgi:hypothetical protein
MKFDFDSLLRRRVEQAESRQAEREASAVSSHEPMVAQHGTMYSDIAGWINEYRKRFVGAVRAGELRVLRILIVDPPKYGDAPPPLTRPDPEPAQRKRERVAAPVAAPVDPHGYQRMSIAELHVAGRSPMPAAQRLELERVLNAKIRESRNPTPHNLTAEEHERAWRNHGGWN